MCVFVNRIVNRQENMLLVRARLYTKYEAKEAARRVAEWKTRRVWTKFPVERVEAMLPREGVELQKVFDQARGAITNPTMSNGPYPFQQLANRLDRKNNRP